MPTNLSDSWQQCTVLLTEDNQILTASQLFNQQSEEIEIFDCVKFDLKTQQYRRIGLKRNEGTLEKENLVMMDSVFSRSSSETKSPKYLVPSFLKKEERTLKLFDIENFYFREVEVQNSFFDQFDRLQILGLFEVPSGLESGARAQSEQTRANEEKLGVSDDQNSTPKQSLFSSSLLPQEPDLELTFLVQNSERKSKKGILTSQSSKTEKTAKEAQDLGESNKLKPEAVNILQERILRKNSQGRMELQNLDKAKKAYQKSKQRKTTKISIYTVKLNFNRQTRKHELGTPKHLHSMETTSWVRYPLNIHQLTKDHFYSFIDGVNQDIISSKESFTSRRNLQADLLTKTSVESESRLYRQMAMENGMVVTGFKPLLERPSTVKSSYFLRDFTATLYGPGHTGEDHEERRGHSIEEEVGVIVDLIGYQPFFVKNKRSVEIYQVWRQDGANNGVVLNSDPDEVLLDEAGTIDSEVRVLYMHKKSMKLCVGKLVKNGKINEETYSFKSHSTEEDVGEVDDTESEDLDSDSNVTGPADRVLPKIRQNNGQKGRAKTKKEFLYNDGDYIESLYEIKDLTYPHRDNKYLLLELNDSRFALKSKSVYDLNQGHELIPDLNSWSFKAGLHAELLNLKSWDLGMISQVFLDVIGVETSFGVNQVAQNLLDDPVVNDIPYLTEVINWANYMSKGSKN